MLFFFLTGLLFLLSSSLSRGIVINYFFVQNIFVNFESSISSRFLCIIILNCFYFIIGMRKGGVMKIELFHSIQLNINLNRFLVNK